MLRAADHQEITSPTGGFGSIKCTTGSMSACGIGWRMRESATLNIAVVSPIPSDRVTRMKAYDARF
jgi:hypothetical protein